MAAKKKKKAVDTWKTKKWVEITSPKSFGEKEIGHTVTSDPEKIVGRVIRTSLREITGNIPHQNIGLSFRVTEVKGEKARTEVNGFELQRGYIGRQRRGMKSLITAIFNTEAKGGEKMRLTVMAMGRNKTNRNQQIAIREALVSGIGEQAKKQSFDKFFQDAIHGKASSEVYKTVRKIYPVNRVEVTKIKLL